jgi:localization factor PodJL
LFRAAAPRKLSDSQPPAMVEDMNKAMAWTIAGVGRQTRDAAEEAARRAGMRLDDWLDEAIADQAALEQREWPQDKDAEDRRLSAAAGRLERIARRNAPAQEQLASGIPHSFDSAVERFEARLSRAEARAARAFESVAEILERSSSARDSDRQALIDAVRRLEAINASWSNPVEISESTPKPPHDPKAAVSRLARRQDFDARVSAAAPTPRPDPDERPESGPTADNSHAPPAAAESIPASSLADALREDIQTLALKLDDLRREQSDSAGLAVDLDAMRAEIAAMRRSLADLAPRNAVVALEGAISDLIQRVERARNGGCGESLLAPLEAMAAELSAVVRTRDPQAPAAALEREIRAIGGKIDSLAATAIKPETFEHIRRQTEEARNLLAFAASRTAPLERMEQRIGELAERVEQLGASPAPNFESAEMAAFLAEARRQIERSTPPEALSQIERRLEDIAARLDQEIARPAAPAVIDPRHFDDLARRIDELRQSLEARPPAVVDIGPIENLMRDLDARIDAIGGADADAHALQSMTAEISAKLDRLAESDAGGRWLEPVLSEFGGKLDRLADSEIGARWLEPVLSDLGAKLDAIAAPVDLNPIETSLRTLEAKLDAASPPAADQEIAERVAEEVARRLQDLKLQHSDSDAVARQIARIYDRIDALAAKPDRADNVEAVVRELLDRLRQAEAAPKNNASETLAALHTALGAHLSELRAEQASADRRTHSRLSELQGVLETLAQRLASIESELASDVDEELRPPADAATSKPVPGMALPGVEALEPEVAPRRAAQANAVLESDGRSSPRLGEDFLIEPGAGAPQRAREARELAQMIGPKTNPAVSVHIAAARRAAQAALMESGGAASGNDLRASGLDRAPLAVRGVQNAKAFYASHKRTVLLGVALAIAATLAIRTVGVRAPFLQRSELDGQAVKSAKVETSPLKAGPAGATNPINPAIDRAPTASIPGQSSKPDAPALPQEGAPSPAELAILAGIPPTLRDAVAAGAPAAQYELALRLFEGRGLPKDQSAAARWFERAATAGLAPAQYRLGSMLEKGIGVAPDRAAAKSWYLKAAGAGNARAAHNLAVMDAEPAADEPDYVEAAKWFRKAGELGVRDSQYNLAILYARGLGVGQDLRQSWMWFSLAAQQGDADAAKKRDEVAAKMDPVSLAEAAEDLAKFKPLKADPAANEVAVPPGGWDAAPGPAPTSAPLSQSPAPGGGAHQQTPL